MRADGDGNDPDPHLSDELKLLPPFPLKLSWTTIYNSQDMEAT